MADEIRPNTGERSDRVTPSMASAAERVIDTALKPASSPDPDKAAFLRQRASQVLQAFQAEKLIATATASDMQAAAQAADEVWKQSPEAAKADPALLAAAMVAAQAASAESRQRSTAGTTRDWHPLQLGYGGITIGMLGGMAADALNGANTTLWEAVIRAGQPAHYAAGLLMAQVLIAESLHAEAKSRSSEVRDAIIALAASGEPRTSVEQRVAHEIILAATKAEVRPTAGESMQRFVARVAGRGADALRSVGNVLGAASTAGAGLASYWGPSKLANAGATVGFAMATAGAALQRLASAAQRAADVRLIQRTSAAPNASSTAPRQAEADFAKAPVSPWATWSASPSFDSNVTPDATAAARNDKVLEMAEAGPSLQTGQLPRAQRSGGSVPEVGRPAAPPPGAWGAPSATTASQQGNPWGQAAGSGRHPPGNEVTPSGPTQGGSSFFARPGGGSPWGAASGPGSSGTQSGNAASLHQMAAQLRELVQELAPHHAELNEQREQGAGTRAVRWIASKVGLADNTAQRESDRLWAQISPLQDQMRQRMESLAMGLRPGAGSDMRNEIQASLLRERSLTTALGAARAVLEAAIEAHKLCETAQTWESLDVASTFRQGHVTSTWLSSEATRDSQEAIAKLASALNALAQTGVQLPPTLVGIGEAGLRLNPRGDLYDLALPGAGMRDSFRNSDLEGNVAENIRVAWPELQAITAQLRQDRKSTQQHALEAIRQHVAGVDPAAGKAVADAIDAIETEPEAYLPTYGSAGPR